MEDVSNESSATVEVPVDTFATLIEQTTLLLGQASLSISYTRRLNIVKTLLKDPRKAKTLLKETTAFLQGDEIYLFGKKNFVQKQSKLNAQRKSLWKFLRVVMRKTLLFKNVVYLTKIDHKMEGGIITRQNQVIETKTKMFDLKTMRVQVPENSIMQVQHQMVNTSFTIQKEVPVTSNWELVSLIKIEHVHLIIEKSFTKDIPNVLLQGRITDFITAWEKITQNQEILSFVKGYEIPFASLPSQEKIPNLTKISKEQFSLVEHEVLEMLEKGAPTKLLNVPIVLLRRVNI